MPKLPEIPGLTEFREREDLLRDADFLNLPKSIGPFAVTPMTLRQWTMLRIAKNPLLAGGEASPEQLAQFLWVLNPSYNPGGKGRRRFLQRCRVVFGDPRAWFSRQRAKARAELRRHAMMVLARDFVAETFQDRPPSTGDGSEPSYFSDAAFFCAFMAQKFGYGEQQAMDMPIRKIFQLVRVEIFINKPDVPLGNRSDRIMNDFLAARNAERRKN
jgi:hypothetical protein